MERPYLPIPTPEPNDRSKGRGGGGGLTKPGSARQVERLGDRFDRLETLMNEGRVGELTQDPSSLAPERALVFEVAGGSLADFAKQAQLIGLEFLIEEEDSIAPSDDFKVVKGKEKVVQHDKPVPVHFYLGMPDEKALSDLVTLWRTFQRNEPFARGYAPWRDLFERLVNIRPWGPQDRLQPEDQAFFKERSEADPDTPILCEFEIWFSDDPNKRQDRSAEIRRLVSEAEGQVLSEADHPAIRYHAILASLPGPFIQRVIDLDATVELLKADGVMFIRPQSVAAIEPLEIQEEGQLVEDDRSLPSNDPPLVAVLDGYPLQNHVLLAGRLEIDDPDGLAARYVTEVSREHGTSMASLIIHGDLNRPVQPIRRRIHVRPVMCCESGQREHFPPERLLVDTIYRAVTRLFDGEGDEPPTAPTTRVINLSLGDESRPFARRMSPWARLLDYLAWRYQVLFIVSAGNVVQSVALPGFAGILDLEQAEPANLQVAVLDALNQQRATRSILSPAESINALSVGAHHEDGLQQARLPGMHVNPFVSPGLPSVLSRLGLGYRGAVKPEILAPGGRAILRISPAGNELRLVPRTQGTTGLSSAVSGGPGQLSRTANRCSTSTAAAIATRQAHLLMEELIASGRVEDGDPVLSLYAKALLVHHAKLHGGTFSTLKTVVQSGQGDAALKRDIARFTGFGATDHGLNPGCEQHRAILVGHGALGADKAHKYVIPAPEDLSGVRGWRAITVTVAWFTPINPRNQVYRMAKLEVKLPNCLGASGDHLAQVDPHSRGKGTVFHTRIEGDAIAAIPQGQSFHFDIECFPQAGPLDELIPYAVAVSVEVGADLGIDVYSRIAQRLQVQVRGGEA